MPLGGLANAVNITDGASARVHMSALAAAAILVQRRVRLAPWLRWMGRRLEDPSPRWW
jgi:hypothetical protein